MRLSEEYIGSMLIGNRFNQKYGDVKEFEDWNGSEECLTVTFLTYQMMHILNISMENALDYVMNSIIDNNYALRSIIECDISNRDFYHGFLAGEILGMPTQKNMETASDAEDIWGADIKCTYLYFRDVLNAVKERG